jgi:hypothetical protein
VGSTRHCMLGQYMPPDGTCHPTHQQSRVTAYTAVTPNPNMQYIRVTAHAGLCFLTGKHCIVEGSRAALFPRAWKLKKSLPTSSWCAAGTCCPETGLTWLQCSKPFHTPPLAVKPLSKGPVLR